MQPLLRYAKAKKEEIIETVRQMVECESPSDSPADVNRYVDLLVEHSKDIAIPRIIKSDKYGKHLRLEFKVPGKGSDGRILGIGHSDTVWPLGTLKSMPYRRQKGRLWGPGVLDMKAGIAFFIYAARSLRDLDIPTRRNIDLPARSRPLAKESPDIDWSCMARQPMPVSTSAAAPAPSSRSRGRSIGLRASPISNGARP
jgi:glutamate carboxypeptidase